MAIYQEVVPVSEIGGADSPSTALSDSDDDAAPGPCCCKLSLAVQTISKSQFLMMSLHQSFDFFFQRNR